MTVPIVLLSVRHRLGGESHKRESTRMITAYQFLSAWVTSRVDDDRGASLVEYALLVALIAVVCIAAVTLLGSAASEKFSTVSSNLE